MSKRKLFIGSSEHAIKSGVVQKIIISLKKDVPGIDSILWTLTAWNNLETALNSLSKNIDEFYYALFIGFPDDIATIKGSSFFVTRDNVVFEFGLFLSRLGIARTFWVIPKLEYNILPTSPVDYQLEFHIISDIGPSSFTNNYSIKYKDSSSDTSFKYDASKWESNSLNIRNLIRQLNESEDIINSILANPSEKIKTLTEGAIKEIESDGHTDEYYVSKFKNDIDRIIYAKSAAISKNVQETLKDILQYISDVDSILDVSELAKEQVVSKHISEVWVFSEEPLEFSPNPDKPFAELRETVINNLIKNVKYYYFVKKGFQKSEIVKFLEAYITDINDRNRALENIQIIVLDETIFLTYFTLHFKQSSNKPFEIYISMKHPKRNDLVIKLKADHRDGIFQKISNLKGVSDFKTFPILIDRSHHELKG